MEMIVRMTAFDDTLMISYNHRDLYLEIGENKLLDKFDRERSLVEWKSLHTIVSLGKQTILLG